MRWVWLALLMIANVASADDVGPKAIITDIHGQPLSAEMPLGEAVVFSARTSVADDGSAMWTILPDVRDKRKYVSPDGLDVFVPIGQKNVTITAVLSVSKIVDGKARSHHTIISVKCGEGDLPPPAPTPGPVKPTPVDPVKPTPVDIPEGTFGLARVSYDGKLSVTSPTRSADAKTIAAAFRFAVDQSKDQPFTLITKLMADSTKKIATTMDLPSRARWSTWQTAIDKKTSELQAAGKLVNLANWLEAYKEIATGLEAGEP